jgi:hypothetical protein
MNPGRSESQLHAVGKSTAVIVAATAAVLSVLLIEVKKH